MKCPLARLAVGWRGSEQVIEHPDCIKEECAWWSRVKEECCFKSLEGDLDRVATFLSAIQQKMPHAGQFLK